MLCLIMWKSLIWMWMFRPSRQRTGQETVKRIIKKKEYREHSGSVEKCLSRNPSCLSLVSYIPTPPSHTQPLSVGCPVPKHTRNISLHAWQRRKTQPLNLPFTSNSWGRALFTNATSCVPQTEEDNTLVEICKRLLANMHDGKCSMTYQHSDGKLHFDTVEINGKGRTKK